MAEYERVRGDFRFTFGLTGRIITFIDKETDKGVRFPEKVPGIRPLLHFHREIVLSTEDSITPGAYLTLLAASIVRSGTKPIVRFLSHVLL